MKIVFWYITMKATKLYLMISTGINSIMMSELSDSLSSMIPWAKASIILSCLLLHLMYIMMMKENWLDAIQMANTAWALMSFLVPIHAFEWVFMNNTFILSPQPWLLLFLMVFTSYLSLYWMELMKEFINMMLKKTHMSDNGMKLTLLMLLLIFMIVVILIICHLFLYPKY